MGCCSSSWGWSEAVRWSLDWRRVHWLDCFRGQVSLEVGVRKRSCQALDVPGFRLAGCLAAAGWQCHRRAGMAGCLLLDCPVVESSLHRRQTDSERRTDRAGRQLRQRQGCREVETAGCRCQGLPKSRWKPEEHRCGPGGSAEAKSGAFHWLLGEECEDRADRLRFSRVGLRRVGPAACQPDDLRGD